MLERNLKGTNYKLSYYRYRQTGAEESKIRRVGNADQIYMQKEIEKIYITEDEVRRFSLDKHGQAIPYVDGHMTIISNYIFDYWGHFLSAEGIALYGHLKRYCYGDKDYCWPDLNLISQKMNKSRNTVKKYMTILENYGFVLMFNVQNADKNNMEESPLFKVRKKVPFLPMDLYEQLPAELKLDHDRYMQSITEQFDQILNLDPSIDYSEVYEDVISTGTVVRKRKTPLELDNEMQIQIKMLEKSITEDDKLIWNAALEIMSKRMTKPSYDTWLKGSFCIKKGLAYTVYAQNEFVSNWMKDQLHKMILEALQQAGADFENIEYRYITSDEV